jgi:hypothetical protein
MPIQTEHGPLKPIIYLGAIGPAGLLIVKYKTPPNPEKNGWWLPAPEIAFGEDPAEEMAKLVTSLGLQAKRLRPEGVDSFVANGAWHLVFKYRADVTGDLENENVVDHRWITLESMPSAPEFAHGQWEVDLCRFFLSTILADYV